MDGETIRALEALNLRFYDAVAPDFSASRGRPWSGWPRIWRDEDAGRTVYDAGCGNGRFARFVLARGSGAYLGVDSCEALVEIAKAEIQSSQVSFRLGDVFDPPDHQFGCVVAFGVLHHIPSAERRERLMRTLAGAVAEGGRLIVTFWQFSRDPRLSKRIAPWSEAPEIDTGQLENGDYLVRWSRGVSGLRYCHECDDVEVARLVTATGLERIDDFAADGKSGNLNRYVVLERPLAV